MKNNLEEQKMLHETILGCLYALQKETRPVEGHTDPESINEAFRMISDYLVENTPSYGSNLIFKVSLEELFDELNALTSETSNANWQIWFSKRKGKFVLSFPNIYLNKPAIEDSNIFKVIISTIEFIKRQRKEIQQKATPKYTLR